MREAAGKMKSARLACALVVVGAWFCLSNHCALGLASAARELPAPPETGGCPMHSSPAKKKAALKIPCCKVLRAVVAKCVTASPSPIPVVAPCDYATTIFVQPESTSLEIRALDTGPPDYFSFAESVLQESMLSHAPPVS
ncbi:MAG TPA: hypothetical protein VLH83_08770 [Chthoniobacterales bacterium]|nr:hypothetical protein [Chthoniobacterales bacterium]